MTTIREIRLYPVGAIKGKRVLYASRTPSGRRGSYQLRLPSNALAAGTEFIDIRVRCGWELSQSPAAVYQRARRARKRKEAHNA